VSPDNPNDVIDIHVQLALGAASPHGMTVTEISRETGVEPLDVWASLERLASRQLAHEVKKRFSPPRLRVFDIGPPPAETVSSDNCSD
jgi:hypothetical protein